METVVKNVIKWGNSAGILLPKEWAGKQVKIISIDRTLEIKKEVLKIIEPYLEEIIGVYLVGSYARNEQNKDSDIDIIVISNKLKKEIFSERYHISISPLENIKKTLKKNPILVYPRLIEAKTILNNLLLEELKNVKIYRNSFKEFFEGTRRIIKINKKFVKMDELYGEELTSINIIYSLILRLRGIFIIDCLLKKQKYSNKAFKTWILQNIPNIEYDKIYKVYQTIKENKKPIVKIKITEAKNLLSLLKKEVKKYDK